MWAWSTKFAEFLHFVNPSAFCIPENLHVDDYVGVSERLYKEQVGRRLRAVITALGLSQADVAKTFSTAPSKLGNWLRGDNYPSQWFVKQFCERYGITTDWLYRGIVSGMDAAIADVLWKSEQAAQQVKADAPSHPTKPQPPLRPVACDPPAAPLVRGRR